MGGFVTEQNFASFRPAAAEVLTLTDDHRAAYRAAAARVLANLRRCASQVKAETDLAPLLVEELYGRQEAQRRMMVDNDRRFHRIAVCDRLIDQSLRLVHDQPAEARGLADLALSIARQLEDSGVSLCLVRDLQARAWASLANAHRALGEFPSAFEAFLNAVQCLAGGSGDPLEEGHLLGLEALLLAGLGQHALAERLVDRQIEIYRELGHLSSPALAAWTSPARTSGRRSKACG